MTAAAAAGATNGANGAVTSKGSRVPEGGAALDTSEGDGVVGKVTAA